MRLTKKLRNVDRELRGRFIYLLKRIFGLSVIFVCLSFSWASPIQKRIFTFQELNLLSQDLLLKGVGPKQDFYIPTLPQLESGKVRLKILTAPYLREESTITFLIDDIPYKTYKVNELPPEVEIPIYRKNNRDFMKVSLSGNLRISNNICEDTFSDRIYLIIKKDSQVEFEYTSYKNIREFLLDYDNIYCTNDPRVIPFAYQFCKQSPIPCKFQWTQEPSCKSIKFSSGNDLELKNNTLYIPLQGVVALEEDVFVPYLFGSSQNVKSAQRQIKELSSELSLRDLGLKTVSVEGAGKIGYTIPLDTSKMGGLPDRLYLKLHIAHTPIPKGDHAELRIYLNSELINAYPLDGSGGKSFDIGIPTQGLKYGANYISIDMVLFGSSDDCLGTIVHSALTVFEDSYFYWNSLRNNPKSISDFLSSLHGYVALVVKDRNFYPYILKFLSELSLYNKNIKSIDINPEDLSKYDFVIYFVSPTDTKGNIIDLSKGDFEIVNPLTQKIIFSSSPSESFSVITLNKFEGKPALVFSYYEQYSGIEPLFLYSLRDMLELLGNTAIASKDFIASYEVGKKLRVEYKSQKDFRYYWNKYKIWIVLLASVPITFLLLYIYRKLARRSTT
jgi:hypothetical protein